MIPLLLILIPMLSGLAVFFLKEASSSKALALGSSVITLALSLMAINSKGVLH